MANTYTPQSPRIEAPGALHQSHHLVDSMRHDFKEIAHETGNIKIIDFLFGAAMIFFTISVGGGPLSTFLVMVLVFIKIFQKPDYLVQKNIFFAFVIFAGLLWLAWASYFFNGVEVFDIAKRVLRMTSVVLLAMFIGSGRIHLKSLLLGLFSAMVINSFAWAAGIAPDRYVGYLTGWIGDKNVAGLYHAIVPMLLFFLLRNNKHKIILLVLALPLLWLTGSRTSIGAFLIGIAWYLFAHRVNLFFKFFLGAAVIWVFEWSQEKFASSAVFGDRAGTDRLRSWIDAAAWEKVQETPWYGMGIGKAIAQIDEKRAFLFHNSFWTLWVEGGMIWTVLVIIATIFVVFIFRQTALSESKNRNLGAEAAMVAIFICSWRLGEVMMTVPWGFVMGYALIYLRTDQLSRLKTL